MYRYLEKVQKMFIRNKIVNNICLKLNDCLCYLINHLKNIVISVAPFLVLIISWQLVAALVTYLRGVPFPTPWTTSLRLIAVFFGDLVINNSIYRHIIDSTSRWVIGFGLAAFCGIGFGLMAGWWHFFDRLTRPTVYVLQLVPGLAWIPVALLLFGVGEKATFFMIYITAFAPIAINVVDGVKRVDEHYIRAAQMLGTRGKTLFFRVLLPSALPQIISGLRVGLGNSWRVLVAAEMIVGTGTGLGYSIIQARWTLDYTSAFVCIFVICLVGLFIERFVFISLERHTIQRWGLSRTLG